MKCDSGQSCRISVMHSTSEQLPPNLKLFPNLNLFAMLCKAGVSSQSIPPFPCVHRLTAGAVFFVKSVFCIMTNTPPPGCCRCR